MKYFVCSFPPASLSHFYSILSLFLPAFSSLSFFQFKKPCSSYHTHCSCLTPRCHLEPGTICSHCIVGWLCPPQSTVLPTVLGPVSKETSGFLGGGPPCPLCALPLPDSRTPRTRNTSATAFPSGRCSNWFCPLWLKSRDPERSETGWLFGCCFRGSFQTCVRSGQWPSPLSPHWTSPLAMLCHPLNPAWNGRSHEKVQDTVSMKNKCLPQVQAILFSCKIIKAVVKKRCQTTWRFVKYRVPSHILAIHLSANSLGWMHLDQFCPTEHSAIREMCFICTVAATSYMVVSTWMWLVLLNIWTSSFK